jgi:hypothetical protein
MVIDIGKGREGSKDTRMLIVFGTYDHTNDKMHMYNVIKIRQQSSLSTF